MRDPAVVAAAHAAGKHKHTPPQSCPQCREARRAKIGSRSVPRGCGKCQPCLAGRPWWYCTTIDPPLARASKP